VIRYFKLYLFEILILAYILGNAYILVYKKDYFYPYNVLPVVVLVIYLAFTQLEKLVFFLAFATPLAVSLKELGLTESMDLSLPTEPLMAGIMLLYILNELTQSITDKKFARHPLTILIIIQLFWMFITSLTSTEVLISIKYLIARFWFIFSCYVIMHHIFKDRNSIIKFIMLYATGLFIVVIYTTVKHAAFNFNDKAADWVVSPFYNDHTAYGAALAMFIPACFSLVFMKSLNKFLRTYALFLFAVFMVAIVLSFARAGWLSLVVATGVLLTLLLKIKFRTILLALAFGAGVFFVFQTEILMALGRNNTDAEGGFSNNVESVTNISTDASNLERLNRWSCALRMWQDKPVFGWGPGTYMFKYAPYQLSRERTIISTNFGTNGNAHSEYLGPLSEQGLFGLIIVIALLFYVTSLGYRSIYQVNDPQLKILLIGLFLGVMTYFVHGFLNNFLDTDKLSLPFWGFLAAIVCIDLYYVKKQA
jgi:putative inorganic carbon (hco3(-)) transporter